MTAFDLTLNEPVNDDAAVYDALRALNDAAYAAARTVRKVDARHPLAARLKALALETDAIVDAA